MRQNEIAVFGGGCFWCTEAVFKMLKGVSNVLPGYSGGRTENPTYEQVSNGNTGHAEVIYMEYDPALVDYKTLLTVFFGSHDPTTLNRQGNDVGTQYRSAIFYTSEEQKNEAEALIKELNDTKAFDNPVVTEVSPLGKWYEAESYHHDYYEKNKDKNYCQIIIAPKLAKLQEKYKNVLKNAEQN